MVGVREEDTIKGNDEICVLFLSLFSLLSSFSLSLKKRKVG